MVEKGSKGRKEEVVTREYTINLHKRLHGWNLDLTEKFVESWCWGTGVFAVESTDMKEVDDKDRFEIFHPGGDVEEVARWPTQTASSEVREASDNQGNGENPNPIRQREE
ncbi:hypothetical protein IEQ34_005899 [Dendrobium chrysotoxum]|uniref:Uncharacterized protein n=1 Tax=Dendrobium chrysotoxum TaxID=161865 RepID=A0AAV7H9V5_DENCH|nr:hypothetical protein IEQ34_005899 [Dendrobium chrysotoxum]